MDQKERIVSQRQMVSGRLVIPKLMKYKKGLFGGVLLTAGVAWLFYDSGWGMISGFVIIPWFLGLFKDTWEKKRKSQVICEFKEMMQMLSAYMQTGSSLENAFLETEQEIKNLFSEKSYLYQCLHKMDHRVQVSVPVEQAFMEFAREVSIEEAYEFADILIYAKKLGGNYIYHVQQTAYRMEEKMGISQEIETMLAEKRLELKVMIIMPIIIFSYMKFTSGEFIGVLYHSTGGIILMSVCLSFYLAMISLGRKIVDIKI